MGACLHVYMSVKYGLTGAQVGNSNLSQKRK